jgi:hypothetical protein
MTSFSMDSNNIITHYDNIEGIPWNELVKDMMSDPVEKETIELLMADLKAHGIFREPVSLAYEANPEPGESHRSVIDGTHRMCAHIITGISPVLVTEEMFDNLEEAELTPINEEEVTEIIAETRITGLDIDKTEEECYDLIDVVKSLPVDENIWFTSSVSTLGYNADRTQYEITIFWDADDVPADIVNAKVKEKLIRFGYDLSILSIKTENVSITY